MDRVVSDDLGAPVERIAKQFDELLLAVYSDDVFCARIALAILLAEAQHAEVLLEQHRAARRVDARTRVGSSA